MSQTKAPASPKLNLRRNQALSPSSNAPLQLDGHLNPASAAGTLKRPREEDYGEVAEAGTSTDAPEAKRRVKATNDVIYRIVVPSRQIGKVIGRAGHRIQKIREDTQATIKIADAISFFLDR